MEAAGEEWMAAGIGGNGWRPLNRDAPEFAPNLISDIIAPTDRVVEDVKATMIALE